MTEEVKNLIGKKVEVIVDREMGSRHPKHNFLYPINYGNIKGIISSDGEELDAYILGVHEPVASFEGYVIAIIDRKDDDDPKLVVVPEGKSYSDEAIMALVEFQEKAFTSEIIR